MKYKIMKRIASCLLVLCVLTVLSSCSDTESDIPEGMKSATADGADFRLYVPSGWNVNTAYGVSGAFFTATEQSSVSMVKYTITEAMETKMASSATVDPERPTTRLAWYFETEIYPTLAQLADSDTLTAYTEDFSVTSLDGVNARRYHHSLSLDGTELHFLHVVAERANGFYVFSFTATEKQYDSLYRASDSDVKKILKEFKFADTEYRAEEPTKELDDDTVAPDGMKLASGKEVAYLFFVPSDWKINVSNEIFSATSADGAAMVSVTPFSPTTADISVQSYAEDCEVQLKTYSESYASLHADGEKHFEKGTLGGGDALIWEYLYTLNGQSYRGRQAMVGYGGMIYSVTYTARADRYDANLQDAMRIFDEFIFRRS